MKLPDCFSEPVICCISAESLPNIFDPDVIIVDEDSKYWYTKVPVSAVTVPNTTLLVVATDCPIDTVVPTTVTPVPASGATPVSPAPSPSNDPLNEPDPPLERVEIFENEEVAVALKVEANVDIEALVAVLASEARSANDAVAFALNVVDLAATEEEAAVIDPVILFTT